ncbi:MAG TPA: NAD-dependent epimerase/dehydratase family protein [Gemmatimonadales bacterium]|nr:NAD-dependent epimerase/dehydratase family protein [Gemmatimonadales bacterium]
MRPVLITGGAGFIGTNLASRLLSARHPVLILDSLARPGVERNLRWLRDTYADGLRIEVADVRDAAVVSRAVAEASQVFHFAAQVAVTTSLTDPVDDFDVNARGTLTLLEAIRAQAAPPPLVFTSTNKVYGALDDVALRRRNRRYEPIDPALASRGVGESRRLDFHSPYGCSKGCADQYVLDYARSFGLPTIVFRMSCIYGPHQHGTEDQGWVAHFLIRALEDREITIYGDGRQVRDLLFVEDLVDALLLAQTHMPTEAGQAFNIGGGPGNAVSLLEVLEQVGGILDRPPRAQFDDWRLGDQRYYVSDTTKFARATGWRPTTTVRDGIRRLVGWLQKSGRPTALAGGAISVRR